jgi:hypothetical protein
MIRRSTSGTFRVYARTNEMINIEQLSDAELERLAERYGTSPRRMEAPSSAWPVAIVRNLPLKVRFVTEYSLRVVAQKRSRMSLLFDHNDRNANPRMHGIDQEVLLVDVVNVVIVRIRPIRRPRIDKFKPVSRVQETWTILNQDDALHAELVIAAKVLAKSIVWNARLNCDWLYCGVFEVSIDPTH